MEENITLARNLVMRYGKFVQDGHLEGILDALCADATIQAPNVPSLVGKAAIGDFYSACFADGAYHFDLEIEDEKILADIVFINGTLNQSRTRSGAAPEARFRHFSFIMKKESGEMKVWQIRIA